MESSWASKRTQHAMYDNELLAAMDQHVGTKDKLTPDNMEAISKLADDMGMWNEALRPGACNPLLIALQTLCSTYLEDTCPSSDFKSLTDGVNKCIVIALQLLKIAPASSKSTLASWRTIARVRPSPRWSFFSQPAQHRS